MDPFHARTEESSSASQSDQSPTHVASPPHLTQSSSSRTTALQLEASSSSQFPSQDSPPVLSERNQPGFFTGASHVDASHGTFNAVGRDQYNTNNITVEVKGNDVSLLNKLPRAKNAGYLSEHHQKCLAGTRKAELARIEKWEVDCTDKRVYWLNGMAGTGKSTIAQTFAEQSAAGGRLGATFFCSRDFPDRRNIHLIFPTIAFGLAHQYPQFQGALAEVLSSCPDAAEESLAIQLETLLVRPLKSTKLSTTIVIDALDECEDDEPASVILSLLARHIDAIPSIKFFITGRPELQIRSGFRLPLLQPRTEVFVLHDVDPSSVNEDIEFYLRTRLSEIAKERSHWDLTDPWPTNNHISFLVERCCGYFIVASILTKLVGDHRHGLGPREQLQIIIREAGSTIHEGISGVDKMYHQVFLRSFTGVNVLNANSFDLPRLVVGSIVLVFTPLSCADLAKILGIPQESVWNAIRLLHSVLMVPDSDRQALRICHKSFADFITDSRRCIDRRFCIDPSVLHLKLGTCCLELMNASLKKNICDLSPYVINTEIGDLDARREKHIGGGLEYACRSWANHLRLAGSDGEDVEHAVEMVEYFFKHHLLSWLEVLSIVGDMRCAVYSLRDVRGWFIRVRPEDTNLLNIMKDSERFILRFFDVIKASAYHIYHSALLWSPGSSLVRALYMDQISTGVKMLNAIDDLWDASTRTIPIIGHHIAFSYKDDFIAIGENHCVEVFETLTGHRRAAFSSTQTAKYLSVAFSLDDGLLATGRDDGIVEVWDLQTGGLVSSLEGHTNQVKSVVFSSCGTMVASCSLDHTIRIWSLSLRKCRCILEGHSDEVRSVCWSSTRNRVISGSEDRTVKVWDIDEMRCVKTFSGHVDAVLSVASSPDSSCIASGSLREVKIFNAHTCDVFRTIPTDGWVNSIRFLDQNTLMYATNQSTFVIHDLTETTNTPRPKSKNWLNRFFRDAQVRFEFLQSQNRRSKTGPTKDSNVLMFKYQGVTTAISSDGIRIASRTPGAVKIWQTDGPSPNHDMASHHDYVWSVAFSGDGRLVASGSLDNTAKLWDPTTGRCLHTFSHPDMVTAVTFSPDSTLLASSSLDRKIRIWNTRTHNLILTFETPEHNFRHYHSSLGFSPNGNRLVSLRALLFASEGISRCIELWEIATGECFASIEVDGPFDKVAFGVDGTTVTLENNDETMRWSISANQSTSDHGKDGHSSLPMTFVPLHDAQPSVSTRFYYRRGREWIVDEQERRVLWVPPDMRSVSDSYEKKVVLVSASGRVPIVDISDVQV